MAFPVGGVCDGADHPEATTSVPSPIGFSRLGGHREQRMFYTSALALCGGMSSNSACRWRSASASG